MDRKKMKAAVWITVIVSVIALGWAGFKFVRNDALNQAALAGDSRRTAELLSRGANVNGRGMHAMTPIMSAARGGHLNIVELLVAQGGDVNSHNESGSVLMWAVDSGNEALLRYLLQRGADAGWTNEQGSSAYDLAREQKKPSIVQILEAWRK